MKDSGRNFFKKTAMLAGAAALPVLAVLADDQEKTVDVVPGNNSIVA